MPEVVVEAPEIAAEVTPEVAAEETPKVAAEGGPEVVKPDITVVATPEIAVVVTPKCVDALEGADVVRDAVVMAPLATEGAPENASKVSLGEADFEAPGSNAFSEEGDDTEATSFAFSVDGGSA